MLEVATRLLRPLVERCLPCRLGDIFLKKMVMTNQVKTTKGEGVHLPHERNFVIRESQKFCPAEITKTTPTPTHFASPCESDRTFV